LDPKKAVKKGVTLVFLKVERMAEWKDDLLGVKKVPKMAVKKGPVKVESLAERKVLLMVGRSAYQSARWLVVNMVEQKAARRVAKMVHCSAQSWEM